MPAFIRMYSAEEVQKHLDDLNEAGEATTAIGRDARDLPFIVYLIGQYADITNVWMNDPWDYEVEVPGVIQGMCEDCNPHGPLQLEHLNYPVIVMAALK